MTTIDVDARGLDCPEPVVRVRKALLQPEASQVRVLVSANISAENVQRLGESLGWTVERREGSEGIELVLSSSDARPAPQADETSIAAPRTASVIVFITSHTFGEGDETLGRVLMRAFIKTLAELEPRPQKLIFANSGVRLTTEGSDLIEELRALEKQGAEVLSCGTCLDYYHLKDSLSVGSVTNMFEIASSLIAADRVLKP